MYAVADIELLIKKESCSTFHYLKAETDLYINSLTESQLSVTQ